MATTGPVKGKDLLLYVGTTAIGSSTSCSLNISTDLLDVTTKDSNGFKEKLPEDIDWNISCDALTVFDAAYGIDDILDAQLGGTKLSVKFSTEVTGDIVLSGDIYINSNNIDASKGSPSTFSFSGEGTGTLTKSTVSA